MRLRGWKGKQTTIDRQRAFHGLPFPEGIGCQNHGLCVVTRSYKFISLLKVICRRIGARTLLCKCYGICLYVKAIEPASISEREKYNLFIISCKFVRHTGSGAHPGSNKWVSDLPAPPPQSCRDKSVRLTFALNQCRDEDRAGPYSYSTHSQSWRTA